MQCFFLSPSQSFPSSQSSQSSVPGNLHRITLHSYKPRTITSLHAGADSREFGRRFPTLSLAGKASHPFRKKAMSLLHEQQLPLPVSPLIPPPSMDVATLISSKESNGLSYSTTTTTTNNSSASTAVRPTLSLPSQNMSEPTPTSTMVNGRIYRYVRWHCGNEKASDENLQLGHCSATRPGSHVWIWRQGQSVSAMGAARPPISLGLTVPDASRQLSLTLSGVQDRRPITPPPCIRLVVKDASTHKEMDIKWVPFPAAIVISVAMCSTVTAGLG